MKAFELGFTKLNYFFRLCWWAATTPSSPAGPSRCGSGSWPEGNTTPSTGPSCRRTWWTTEAEEGSDSWTTKIPMTSLSYHAGNSLTYGSIKLSDLVMDFVFYRLPERVAGFYLFSLLKQRLRPLGYCLPICFGHCYLRSLVISCEL